MNKSNIIKLPEFNGKKRAFPVWFSQSNATCSVKGCIEALDLNIEKKLPVGEAEAFDTTVGDGKEKKKVKVQNALVMRYLTLAMESSKMLEMIQPSKSPGGLTCDLVVKLIEKYTPDDVTVLADMTTKFSKLKLGKNDDPEDLEDDIATIKN